MGIRPGTTTVDQAMQLLSNSSWVSHVERNQVEVVWTWSGQQPGFLDASVPGVALISFQNQNQITDIIVQSAVPFGEPWIALGSPTHGEGEFYLDPYDQPFVAHNYVYEQYGVLITATLPCPANQAALWQTKVLIEWGDYSRYYPATDVQNQLESHLWCRANP